MELSRKALAVVAGPYRFYQVLWLYTQFPELEWNILFLPYGKENRIREDLHQRAEELGIFAKVFDSDIIGQNSGIGKQIVIFLKMLGYFIIGKRKILMKKIICSETQGQAFDVYFVGCEYSIIEGAIIGLADENEVYIFEEGLSDYAPRKKYPGFDVREIIGFIMSKMGYFSPYQTFELKKVSSCIKYASIPKLLQHRRYKKIRKLFENNNNAFNAMVKKIYNVDINLLSGYDAILFTAVLEEGDGEGNVRYINAIREWVGEHYRGKKILIKKHPRDKMQYNWKEIKCQIWKDNSTPAEVLMGMATVQDILMIEVSTTIVSVLGRKNKVTIFTHKSTDKSYSNWIAYIKGLLSIPDDDFVCI